MVEERGRWAYPPPTSTVLILTSLPRPPYQRMPPAEPLAAVPSDAALIAAWQGGDEQAAAELVRRHARAVARFLGAGLSGGTGDADVDDLVQETFIRAFRALGRFRGQCRFRTWLMTIGGNLLKDAYRRVKRTRVVPLADDLRATDGDPHEHAVAGEMEARLADALGRLPRMQREVFLLRAQQGLEYDEIAAALGTSPGAARVHFHHAVKRLKEQLA
ncbi:MAG: RNA polymerase subunit sigma-24 [Gemmatimonadetes bacterium]|nr:MAG: RNA polymerase subunit sigma-24 [Gemmatimonadota bacterium]